MATIYRVHTRDGGSTFDAIVIPTTSSSFLYAVFVLSLECTTFRRQNHLTRVTPNEKPQMGCLMML